jgi:hypothetical protein
MIMAVRANDRFGPNHYFYVMPKSCFGHGIVQNVLYTPAALH